MSKGIKIECNNGKMLVLPLKNNIVKVVCTREKEFLCEKSPSVNGKERVCDYSTKENDCLIEAETEKLKIYIHKKTGITEYKCKNGKSKAKIGTFEMKEFKSYTPILSENGEKYKTADGVKVKKDETGKQFDKTLYKCKLNFEFDAQEAIFGSGSHEEGFGNLRGKHRELYQHNMKACIPFFVSTKGYACFIDAGCCMDFHDDEEESYVYLDGVREIVYYMIFGADFDEITENYQSLTGTAAMLPKYAFGYWQSRERYKNAEEIVWAAEEYRRRNVPLDVIVLDWQSWPEGQWGQKSLDEKCFPNPKKMIERLHEIGVRLAVSIWPNPSGDCPNQKELTDKGCMLGNNSTYNAFDAKAREIYWNQANEELFCYGTDAWWCDASEPFVGDWFGNTKPEEHSRRLMNVDEAKKYIPCEHLNEYSIYHAMGIYEGQRKTDETKRVLNLTRSVFPGQRRYGTVVWSGDTTATWESLKKQIPEGANFCAAAEPYWTSDIGGFFVKSKAQWFWKGDFEQGSEDLGYRELYTRWLQYVTFLPIMRSHGTDTNREIWNFGEKGDIFYDAIEKFIRLRYMLLPYVYSLGAAVTLKNRAIVRPLALEFPNDKNTYNKSYEYMFGKEMLVAPIYEPMYYGKNCVKIKSDKKFEVYLPCGCGWYDFTTEDFHNVGWSVVKEYPIDKMPLFVREGSIIPMTECKKNTEEAKNEAYEIRIYSGKNARFELYEDEGDNYNYEKGLYSTIEIIWDDYNGEVEIGERKGKFPGMVEEREYVVRVIGRKKDDYRTKTVIYNGEKQRLNFERRDKR